MISALAYLQFVSLKNRALMRLKRLKQPKYLLGGIVGGAYFYFYFIRYLFGVGTHQRFVPLTSSPENVVLFEGLGAAAFLLFALLGWLLPRERAALVFTEAEVAFLFPAPITRRGLIHYKLIRSQLAILFTSLFLMLLSNRLGGKAWIHAAGWWLILSTLNLHLHGASFARTMLLDRGITNWQRRSVILLLLAVCAAVVVLWARRSMPVLDWAKVEDVGQLRDYALRLLTSGPIPWLLYPFRLIVRPYLAQTGSAFLLALLPAAAILAAHYLWVVRSDVAFEEASVDASRKLAEKMAAVRSGNWQRASRAIKVRRAPFALRPHGPPYVALFWKNLISAGQAFSWRTWLVVAIVGVSISMGVGRSTEHSNLAAIIGSIVAVLFLWSLLFGAQLLRQDFRQDMSMADLLKGYPLRGWQVALGELLAPSVILSAIQLCLLSVSALLAVGTQVVKLDASVIATVAAGVAILVPMLNLLTLQIPNAAVLLFPSWFQTGKEGPRGLEATGQRIIFMLGQALAYIAALVPAGAVFGVVFFGLGLVVAFPLTLLSASVLAGIVLAGEVALGIMLLGRLFERLDLSSEQGNP